MPPQSHNKQPNPYQAIDEMQVGEFKGLGKHPVHGHDLYDMELHTKPVAHIERDLLSDADRLIGALDGSVDVGEGFLYDERRTMGPVDGVIYLDKSARPVRALVSELWADMSDVPKPQASFLNIDKESWLYAMGYSRDEFRNRYINPKDISLDKMDPDYLLGQVARIRSLYLEGENVAVAEELIGAVESGEKDSEALLALWDMPTAVDDRRIAIVDEVKSTKATLTIADMLLQRALPDTEFEPLFFSTPDTLVYDFYDQGKDEMYKKISDTERPIWYTVGSSDGRGGIEDADVTYSERSTHRKQRLGKFVLSTSYSLQNGRPDKFGADIRRDIKTLAQRYRAGEVYDFTPTAERKDYKALIEQYYGMPFAQWRDRRRKKESMRGMVDGAE